MDRRVLLQLLATAATHGVFPRADAHLSLFRGASSSTGITYYVSNSGLDSNNGTSPSTPWQTIAKVNSGPAGGYRAGDRILFNGGQTFTGGLTFGASNWSSVTPPTPSSPVTIGSYNTGRATISATAVNGFTATNIGSFTLRDLIFVGDGISTSPVDGVAMINSNASPTQISGVQLLNLDVSFFGVNGINFSGLATGSTTSGYTSAVVQDCTIHHCTGYHLVNSFSAGVNFAQKGTYVATIVHFSPFVNRVLVHDCTGAGADNNGHGIIFNYTQNAFAQFCETANNGINSSGSVGGPWFWYCNGAIAQFCEAHHTGTSGVDGDGFDFDSGNVNCTYQYCYSHDNYGMGFLVYSYNDGLNAVNTGSTIRYCISQNNGNSVQSGTSEIYVISINGLTTGLSIYNNTCFTNVSSNPVLNIAGSSASTITGNIANNIFYASGSRLIVQNGANSTGLHLNGNDYFHTGAGTFGIQWNGVTYTSVAAFHAAFPAQQETVNGGFSVDPQLVNAGGGGTTGGYVPASLTAYQLHIGSPMIGAGINMQTQFTIAPGTQDYYGNTIPNGTGSGYNIGAYGGLGV